ncbi:MAG: vitamin B12 transporter [Gammaproteobacteria bacterium]|jgi:vitamin B12 transporter
MHYRQIILPLVFGTLPIVSFAATTTAPIIVTATRTAQTVDETLASVSVLTQADIQQRQVRSVTELLKGVPGLTVSNNGGRGKNTSVFIRGTESDHVLVLIDGIKVGSASLGTTAFQDLPIAQIDRVEIVRGPRSSLYGSEAIGGVIQIFTKRGGGEINTSLSVGGGSFGSKNAAFGISGGGDNSWFNLSVSSEETDGFNSCTGQPLLAGCFTIENDDDSHENDSVHLRAGFRPSDKSEFDVQYLNSQSQSEFDGDFQNETDTEQKLLGTSLRLSPSDSVDVTLQLGKAEDLSQNFKDGVFASRFDTKRDSVTVQGDFYLGDNTVVTTGIDYLNDKVGSDTPFAQDSRDNTGVFAQYQGQLGQHDLQVGLRQDDNEQFGTNTTGNVAVGHQFAGGSKFTLGYGTAFKAPTFNELYFPGFGNPDLDPEEAKSLELGLADHSDSGHWSLNVFQSEIDNLIGFDPVTFAPINIGKADINGFEAVLGRRGDNWSAAVALTLLDHEDSGGGFNDGNVLPRRAEETLRIDLDRNFGKYSIGTTIFSEGDRYDDLGNTLKLDSYTTVDLRGQVELGENLMLKLHIENLFDEEYETAAYFNQSERAFYLTFQYQTP